MPDGNIVWISGKFEQITRPTELIYSWRVDPSPPEAGEQRVTVRFERRDEGKSTEVIIVHERSRSAEIRRSHEQGWIGCLDGLVRFVIPLPTSA